MPQQNKNNIQDKKYCESQSVSRNFINVRSIFLNTSFKDTQQRLAFIHRELSKSEK